MTLKEDKLDIKKGFKQIPKHTLGKGLIQIGYQFLRNKSKEEEKGIQIFDALLKTQEQKEEKERKEKEAALEALNLLEQKPLKNESIILRIKELLSERDILETKYEECQDQITLWASSKEKDKEKSDQEIQELTKQRSIIHNLLKKISERIVEYWNTNHNRLMKDFEANREYIEGLYFFFSKKKHILTNFLHKIRMPKKTITTFQRIRLRGCGTFIFGKRRDQKNTSKPKCQVVK